MACTTPIAENRWYDLFPKNFVNTYVYEKAAIELFERYRAQLPAVQGAAEAILKIRILNSELEETRQVIRKLENQLNAYTEQKKQKLNEMELHEQASMALFHRERETLPTVQEATDAVTLLTQIRQEYDIICQRGKRKEFRIGQYKAQKNILTTNIQELRRRIHNPVYAPVGNLIRCLTLNCNAFLNAKMYCGICTTEYCAECQEVKHEGECDRDKLANVKYIRFNTRSCPRCATAIQKIEGCDQMFCVTPECNTFFSYQSGKEIKSGPLHNPHYLERLQAGGLVALRRDPIDNNCNGLPDIILVQRAFLTPPRLHDPIYKSILNYHQSIGHIMDQLEHTDIPQPYYIRDAMLKFLLGSVDIGEYTPVETPAVYTKSMFIDTIRTRYKYQQEHREYDCVLRMCRDISCDLFRNFIHVPYDMEKLYGEFIRIATITNTEFVNIAKLYGHKPYRLFSLDPGTHLHLNFIASRHLKTAQPWSDLDNPAVLTIQQPI
jgi:hypothetical protein